MSLRPTWRGYAVIGAVVGALVAGAVFGARALDAVVLPGVVALVAAVVQLRRPPDPDLDRTLPPADVAGTAGTVTIDLSDDRTYPVTVHDRLPAGVDADRSSGSAGRTEVAVDAAAGGGPASYGIVPHRRGEHVVGPATVAATDVLGLFRRSTTVDRRDTLVTFPRIGELPGALGAELRAAHRSRESMQRTEFDDLREYVRGDALRDIHWKSSARHDELMVREFADRSDPERVTVAVGVADSASGDAAAGDVDTAADTPADRMADAAATVCVSLVRDGASVALATPSGGVDAAPGRVRPALRHLAVTDGGPVPTADADIVVLAERDAVSVRFDGREHRLEGRIDGARSLREVSEGIDGDAPSGRPHGAEAPAEAAPEATPGREVAPDGSGVDGGGHGDPDASERGGDR